MNNSQQRKLDKFTRETAFIKDNSVDFAVDSQGGKTANALNAVIADIQKFAAQQVSGSDDKNQFHGLKDDAETNLNDDLRQINLAAKAMASEVAGIEDKFRLSRKGDEQTLLAKSRSFQIDGEPLKAKFIEYGLPANFLEDLKSDITAFEKANNDADNAATSQTEATAALLDLFRRGMDLSRKLDAIVQIKYRANAGKLGAWVTASHLERAPKTDKGVSPKSLA